MSGLPSKRRKAEPLPPAVSSNTDLTQTESFVVKKLTRASRRSGRAAESWIETLSRCAEGKCLTKQLSPSKATKWVRAADGHSQSVTIFYPTVRRRTSVNNRKYKKTVTSKAFRRVGVQYNPFPTAYEASLASVEYRFRVDKIFRDAVTKFCLSDSGTQAKFTRALKSQRTKRRERQKEKNRAYLRKEHIRRLENGEKRLIECIPYGKQVEMLRGHDALQDLEQEISSKQKARLIMQCDTVLAYCRAKLKALRKGHKITEKALILEVTENSIYKPSFSAVRSWLMQFFEFDDSDERAFTFRPDGRGRSSKETLIDDPDVAAQLKMFCLQKLKSLTVGVVRNHINDNILNAQDDEQRFIIKDEQLEKCGIVDRSICTATRARNRAGLGFSCALKD